MGNSFTRFRKGCMRQMILCISFIFCCAALKAQNYNVTTTSQCNSTTGGMETINFTGATPNAIGNATLIVYFGDGDLGSPSSEYLDISDESNTFLGQATHSGGDCATYYDTVMYTLSSANINSWAANGTISITVDASAGVNNFCGPSSTNSFCVYATLTYPRASGLNDIGVASIDTPTVFCAGSQNIWVTIQNYGTNQVDTATVNWTWNGVAQTPVNVYQLIDTAQGTSPNNLQVMLGSKTITDADTLVVWTSNPNNSLDTTNINDTISKVLAPSLMGTYTLNAALATGSGNYQSFADFVNDLANNGICGPIVLNVAPGSGPYNEQVDIPQISGSSATNTITINGSGDTLTSAGSASNYATLNLNGADYITFNNLVIEASSTSSNFAVHLMNGADNNTFDSCVIMVNIAATSSTTAAVSMSGSKTSYSSGGNNGSNNTFSYCTVVGGYFGLAFYGSSASSNVNNSITNCTIQDFYLYGSYNIQQSGATIANNLISRPTRATVTTFYGIMLSTGCNNMLVEKNEITNATGTASSTGFTAYCIYNSAAASLGNENKIYNNIVHNIGNTSGTTAGLYMPNGTYVQAYHNTLVLNTTAATSGTTYGIYSTGSAGVDLKNNNIFITQGGSGTKYGIYFSGSGKTSNYNNIFVNSASGTNNTGYYSGAFATLLAWQGANSSAWDQNSLEVNPIFANLTAGNLTPSNSLMNDMGTPVGITTDITGATRSTTTPDIGAIEFSVAACAGTPTPGTATAVSSSVCLNNIASINLTGFTLGSGITIQWEESPVGAGMWTPISGATTGSLSDTLFAATDYRAVVTCANGGGFDVSNTVSINVSPFYLCYCSPKTGVAINGTNTYNYLENVNITGGSLNNTTTVGGYNQYWPTTAATTDTFVQGQQYKINTDHAFSGNYVSVAWIDYDQSGTFDTSEYILLATTSDTATAIFNVPLTATAGLTGMRVSHRFSGINAADACLPNGAYEVEDYVINILTAPTCGGQPVAGTASAPSTICANNSFTLNLQNNTFGIGISIQWEESPAGAGSWTAISGATNATHTITAGISTATDYRAVVTCANGGAFDNSNVVSVSLSAFYLCYCSPNNGGVALNGSNTYNYLENVSILNTSLNNTTTTGGYNHYWPTTTSTTTTLMQGMQYTLSTNHAFAGNYISTAWIDYDNSGTFDTLEYIPLTTISDSAAVVFTVPITALAGLTGLRVSHVFNGLDAGEACLANGAYEVEDYVITIIAAPACSGTPSAGIAYAPASVCGGVGFTLNDTAYTVGSGITVQWQSSPASTNTWTNITGATTISYNVASGIVANTDFRMIINCSNSLSSDTSNVVAVSIITYSAPWTYDVETQPVNSSMQMADCWNASPIPSSQYSWQVENGPTSSSSTGPDVAHSGSKYFYTEASSSNGTGSTADLTTPLVNIGSITQPIVEFYYHMYGATIDKFYISASSNGSTWTVLDSVVGQQQLSGTDPWTKKTVALTGFTGGVQVRFTGVRGTSFTGDMAIDDIAIMQMPTCPTPTALLSTAVTDTSATLNWTENGTATQWHLEYGTAGFTPGTGTVVNVSAKPYTLTGLTANTSYDIYVRAICSATDSSLQSFALNINTNQIPQSVFPYAQNWESGGTDWTYVNGSQTNKWFVGAPGANASSLGGLYISADNGLTNGYTNTAPSIVHAYRDLDLTSFSAAIPLTFNSYVVGESGFDFVRVYMVPLTYMPTAGIQIVAGSGITQLGPDIEIQSGWTPSTLSIPVAFAGTTSRLVIEWTNDISLGNAPVKLDNLTIGGFPLAVELDEISAVNVGAKNRVDWNTLSEDKGDKFELERSADGRNFTYLATINANGEAATYSYMDETPVSGVNYYRLKMIDASSKYSYSKTVTATVKVDATFGVNVHPNPASNQITVTINGMMSADASIVVTDISGRIIKSLSQVSAQTSIDLTGLANGIYLVKYSDATRTETVRVHKK